MNTQIQQIVKMFLNYPQLMQSWSATEFVFLSEESVGFKVSTPNYNGTVIITFQDNSFYSVSFRDLEFKNTGNYRCGESPGCSEGLCGEWRGVGVSP